ncbi:BHLH domain-containing protein [Psidium guajava]|nr:BHLH domain-containing protein [Psidium guajava]
MKLQSAILLSILVLLLLRFEPNEACRSLHQRDEYQNHNPHRLFNVLQKGPVRPPGNGCSYTPSSGGAPCTQTRNFAGHATVVPPVSHAIDKEMVRSSVAVDRK